MNEIYPFKLKVKIHEACDLAAADSNGLSDPFVIASINDKVIGKSSTIYKNLNPKWDLEFPEIGLIVIQRVLLTFRVYDEDTNSCDELLGVAKVELSTLEFDKEIELELELEQFVNESHRGGHLRVSITLTDESTLVQIEPTNPNAIQTFLPKHIQESEVVIGEEHWVPTDPILRYFSIHPSTSSSHEIDDDLDMIRDAGFLESGSNPSYSPEFLCREYQRICIVKTHSEELNSILLNVPSSNSPMITTFKDSELLMETGIFLRSESGPLYFFRMNNKFQVWVWLKWFRLVLRVWQKNLDPKDLPDWAADSGGKYRFSFELFKQSTGVGAASCEEEGKLSGKEKDSSKNAVKVAGAVVGAIGANVGAVGSAIGEMMYGLPQPGVPGVRVAGCLSIDRPYSIPLEDSLPPLSLREVTSLQITGGHALPRQALEIKLLQCKNLQIIDPKEKEKSFSPLSSELFRQSSKVDTSPRHSHLASIEETNDLEPSNDHEPVRTVNFTLEKYSRSGLIQNWKARDFRLEDTLLLYFEGNTLKGSFDMTNSTLRILSPKDAFGKPFPFQIQNDKELMLLNAPSSEIRLACMSTWDSVDRFSSSRTSLNHRKSINRFPLLRKVGGAVSNVASGVGKIGSTVASGVVTGVGKVGSTVETVATGVGKVGAIGVGAVATTVETVATGVGKGVEISGNVATEVKSVTGVGLVATGVETGVGFVAHGVKNVVMNVGSVVGGVADVTGVSKLTSGVADLGIGLVEHSKGAFKNLVFQVNTFICLKVGVESYHIPLPAATSGSNVRDIDSLPIVLNCGLPLGSPIARLMDLSSYSDISKFDVLLLHGPQGTESLIGQCCVDIAELLQNGKKHQQSESGLPIYEIQFRHTIGFQLSEIRASGLMNRKHLNRMSNMVLTCRFVRSDCHSSRDHGSRVVSKAGRWEKGVAVWEGPIILDASKGYHYAHFVRIDIHSGAEYLGSVFIPICNFNKEEIEFKSSVFGFRNLNGMFGTGSGGTFGLGEVCLKSKKIVDEEFFSDKKFPKIRLHATPKAYSPYTVSYPVEALSAGGQNEVKPESELFCATLAYDYLALTPRTKKEEHFEEEEVDEEAERSDDEESSPSSSPPQTPNKHSQTSPEKESLRSISNPSPSTISLDEPIDSRASFSSEVFSIQDNYQEVSVFENQRRHPLPPFDWGDGNLFPLDQRTRFSIELGNESHPVESLDKMVCPAGYEWVPNEDWKIDLNTIETDSEGWSYAIAFKYLEEGFERREPLTRTKGRYVRRRRWVRLSRPLNSTSPSNSSPTGRSRSVTSSSKGSRGRKSNASSEDRNSLYWRQPLFKQQKHQVLVTCKEKSFENSPILIPWDQVVGSEVITASLLSVTVTCGRYFGMKEGEAIFRDANVDLFFCGCDALELKRILNVRMVFAQYRPPLTRLLSKGSIYGDRIPDQNENDICTDLSRGAQVMMDLENDVVSLRNDIQHLSTVESSVDKFTLAFMRSRCRRLTIYMNCLLGACLTGVESLSREEAKSFIQHDCEKALRFKLEDEVHTVSNRIEFLLDSAEARIQDSVLCGWSHVEDGLLKGVIEEYVKGYLLATVQMLARFFNPKNMETIQGLLSKTKLLTAFMQHDSRLNEILNLALVPLEMHSSSQIRLSKYLDFHTLLTWYHITLREEMHGVVENTMRVWSKSNEEPSQEFVFNLPWIPQKNGQLYSTNIANDAQMFLEEYLSHAYIKSEDVTAGFVGQIGKLSSQIALCYASSFSHLAKIFQMNLLSSNWQVVDLKRREAGPCPIAPANQSVMEQTSQQLIERARWLCSVANDCVRMSNPSMILDTINTRRAIYGQNQLEDHSHDTEFASTISVTYSTLQKTQARALDYISCVIMTELSNFFHDPDSDEAITDFLSENFSREWIVQAKRAKAGQEAHDSFHEFMESFSGILGQIGDCLDSLCFHKLLCICATKIFVRYLLHLKSLADLGVKFQGPDCAEIKQILLNKEEFVQQMTDLERGHGASQFQGELEMLILRMNQIILLLTEPEDSSSFKDSIKSMQKIASGNPKGGIAYANLIRTCLRLRADMSPQSQTNNRSSVTSSRSSITFTAPKRGSMFASFSRFLGGDISQSTNDALSSSSTHASSSMNLSPYLASTLELIEDDSEDMLEEDLSDLGNIKPIVKAFYLTGDRFKFSLENLLLHSACPGGKLQSLSLQSRASKSLSKMTSHSQQEDLNILFTDLEWGSLKISDLRVYNLFFLSDYNLSKPKTQLHLTVRARKDVTTATDGSDSILAQAWSEERTDTLDPDWTSSPLSLTLSHHDGDGFSGLYMYISLYYLTYLSGKTLIGEASLSLASLNMSSSISQIQVPFEFSDPKVLAAHEKSQREGRTISVVNLSVSLER